MARAAGITNQNLASEVSVNSKEIEISRKLKSLAETINKRLKKVSGQEVGFFLLVGNIEAGGRCNYISNMSRKDSEKVMLEVLERWSDGMKDIPTHKLN